MARMLGGVSIAAGILGGVLIALSLLVAYTDNNPNTGLEVFGLDVETPLILGPLLMPAIASVVGLLGLLWFALRAIATGVAKRADALLPALGTALGMSLLAYIRWLFNDIFG